MTVELLSTYDLRSIAELREYKPWPEDEYQMIEHLVNYNNIYYL